MDGGKLAPQPRLKYKEEGTPLESQPWKKISYKDPDNERDQIVQASRNGVIARLPEDRSAILSSNSECCKTEEESTHSL